MNYNEAIKWCQENPLKVIESNTKVMYYDNSEDINNPYECDCLECECENEHYYPIGIVELQKDIVGEDNGDFNIVYEINLIDDLKQTIDIKRYNWVTKRGYEKEPHKYTLTTLWPYAGFLYIGDKSIGRVVSITENNEIDFGDFLKKENLIGKDITIKNIYDKITGYKCRWPEICGESYVVDVGEISGMSCCAICQSGEGCTMPSRRNIL